MRLKLKKYAIGIIGLFLIESICLTGCGENKKNTKDENKQVQNESKSKGTNKSKSFSMDKIDWSVDQGVVDGDRYVLLSITNNSDYTLTDFELTFKQKEDNTPFYDKKFY